MQKNKQWNMVRIESISKIALCVLKGAAQMNSKVQTDPEQNLILECVWSVRYLL